MKVETTSSFQLEKSTKYKGAMFHAASGITLAVGADDVLFSFLDTVRTGFTALEFSL